MSRNWNLLRHRAWLICAAVGGLTLFGIAEAMAASKSLMPGYTINAPATTAAIEPDLRGTVVFDRLLPFQSTGGPVSCSGYIQTRAVESKVTHRLHFYFRVITTGGVGGSVFSFTVHGFPGSQKVAYRRDGGGSVAPYSASRSTDGEATTFNLYGNSCSSKFSSRFILVKTNAQFLSQYGWMTIDIPETWPPSMVVGTARVNAP